MSYILQKNSTLQWSLRESGYDDVYLKGILKLAPKLVIKIRIVHYKNFHEVEVYFPPDQKMNAKAMEKVLNQDIIQILKTLKAKKIKPLNRRQ